MSYLNDVMKKQKVRTKPVEGPAQTKRQKYIKSAITAKVNTTGNARSGKSYFEEYDSKKGGYWHTYDNGKRVFVKKHGTTTLPKKGQTGGTYKYLNRSQSA